MRLIIITQTVDADAQVLGFFVEWIRALAARSAHVTVIARSVGRHDLPSNVTVRSMGAERGVGKIGRILNLWHELWRALPESDGVFIHMIPLFALVAWPLVKLRRKPLVLWYTHKSVDVWLRVAVWCVDRVLTASKESFRLASPKVTVVGHGIPMHPLTPRVPHQGFRVLSVGRLSPVKGFDVLVRALARLDADVTLTIVGAAITPADKAYEAALVEQIHATGLEHRVKLAGARSYERMPEAFATHDLFLHASETGSLDKVMLEAAASGMPVVTSSEAFADLDISMRFPKGDDAALAERIRDWRQRLVEGPNAARAFVERVRNAHGLPQLADRIISAFRIL